jgi:hypothetical protein
MYDCENSGKVYFGILLITDTPSLLNDITIADTIVRTAAPIPIIAYHIIPLRLRSDGWHFTENAFAPILCRVGSCFIDRPKPAPANIPLNAVATIMRTMLTSSIIIMIIMYCFLSFFSSFRATPSFKNISSIF